jgi:hypothetical protein
LDPALTLMFSHTLLQQRQPDSATSLTATSDASDIFDVEVILKKRSKARRTEYLVKWEGELSSIFS